MKSLSHSQIMLPSDTVCDGQTLGYKSPANQCKARPYVASLCVRGIFSNFRLKKVGRPPSVPEARLTCVHDQQAPTKSRWALRVLLQKRSLSVICVKFAWTIQRPEETQNGYSASLWFGFTIIPMRHSPPSLSALQINRDLSKNPSSVLHA